MAAVLGLPGALAAVAIFPYPVKVRAESTRRIAGHRFACRAGASRGNVWTYGRMGVSAFGRRSVPEGLNDG